jgi:hypothetical protein
MGELEGKSEKIILKLKKLKQKSYIANDTESLNDIDWFKFYLPQDYFLHM